MHLACLHNLLLKSDRPIDMQKKPCLMQIMVDPKNQLYPFTTMPISYIKFLSLH